MQDRGIKPLKEMGNNMYPWISKYLFYYPIQKFRQVDVNSVLKELKYNQNNDYEQIVSYQKRKILNLINFAFSEIPFYKRIYRDYGVNPCSLFLMDDFKKIPIIKKEDIKKYTEELIDKVKYRLNKRTTSGTSGNPLTFYKDNYSESWLDGTMYYLYRKYGIDVGTKQGRIWGSGVNLRGKLKITIVDFLMNRVRMSAFSINDEKCEKYYRKLMHLKPYYLYAYPNALYEFCLYLKKKNMIRGLLILKL